jgi:transmembrane sensor
MRLQALFKKYLENRCTPSELEELVELLQQADSDEQLNDEMAAHWQQLKTATTDYPVDWDKMYGNIMGAEEHLKRGRKGLLLTIRYRWFAAAAVLLLVLAGAGWYINHLQQGATKDKLVVVNTPAVKTTESPVGKQFVYLPDGSTVVLNAGSTLDYPRAFNGNSREVTLLGEGYFDIKHNADKPFIVHSGNLSTRVLGTAFDIKAYPNHGTIEVTVTRGKVQVMKNDNIKLGIITANQQIVYTRDNDDALQKNVDVKAVLAWKPAEMLFDNNSLQEVANYIQSKFGVQVLFANDNLKNCKVSATFNETDSLDELLTVVCAVSDATYSINNHKITINGKGCN